VSASGYLRPGRLKSLNVCQKFPVPVSIGDGVAMPRSIPDTRQGRHRLLPPPPAGAGPTNAYQRPTIGAVGWAAFIGGAIEGDLEVHAGVRSCQVIHLVRGARWAHAIALVDQQLVGAEVIELGPYLERDGAGDVEAGLERERS